MPKTTLYFDLLTHFSSQIIIFILALRNYQIIIKILSTKFLQQTELSPSKYQILYPDYSLTQLLNGQQFNLVARAWFGFEATQHNRQLSV